MGRKIGAGVAGILIAFVLVALIETLGHMLWPLGIENEQKIDLANVAVGAMASVLVAWVFALFAGVLVAARIVKGQSMWPPSIVAVLFLASCAFNVAAIAHPLWFLIAAGVAIPATLMAAFAVSKRLKGNNS